VLDQQADAVLPLPLHTLEAGFPTQNLLVQPLIDDALPEAPLLSQLRRGNPLLLGPLVNSLRREPQIGGDLLDRENLAVEGRSASPAITPCHGCLGRCVESAAVSNGGMLRPRNRGIVSGLPGTGVAFSSPRISLFTA